MGDEWWVTKWQSDGVSGNGGNIGGRFGRDGMRFGWDLMAKGWSGIWFMTDCDNDPVVQEHAAALEKGDTPTPAQERAFHSHHSGNDTQLPVNELFWVLNFLHWLIYAMQSSGPTQTSISTIKLHMHYNNIYIVNTLIMLII